MGWLSRIGLVGLVGLLCLPPAAQATDCVILLHGFTRSAQSLQVLAGALEAAGYHTEAPDYPSTRHSMRQLAAPVIETALTRCPKTGAVHFVGHSLGAILVRVYLEPKPPDLLDRLGRVVMLAPPNQGSELPDIVRWIPGFKQLLGPALIELGTGPESVPRQLSPPEFAPGIIAGNRSSNRLLSLAIPGVDDGRINLTSTRTPGMSDYLVLPVHHLSILKDPTAIEAVLRFLETGRFEGGG